MTGIKEIQQLKKELTQFKLQLSVLENKVLVQKTGLIQDVRNDFKEIIDYSNNWVGNMLTIFSIIIWLLWIGIGLRIQNLADRTEKASKEAKEKKSEIDETIKKAGEKQIELEESIKNQDQRIFNHVMETLTNYRFDRIEKEPWEISNLFSNITVLEKQLVRKRVINYDILWETYNNNDYHKNTNIGKWHIIWLCYQFFPDKLFINNNISERWKTLSHGMGCSNYYWEIIESTRDIFNIYTNNNNREELKEQLKIYLTLIHTFIIINNNWLFNEVQIRDINNLLDDQIIKVWENTLRKQIKEEHQSQIKQAE